MHLAYDDLANVKAGQIVLVNLAEPTEKQHLTKLTIVINDPFNSKFTCRNEKDVTGDVNYESVFQVLNQNKKRKHVKFIFNGV